MQKLVTGRRTFLALVFFTAIVFVVLRGLPDGRLHVWFLDVGQGDALLIQAPDGRQILVDGGPSPSVLLEQLGEVLPFWDRSLDLVVLTHPDADHVSGLIPVFDRYEVATAVDALAADEKGSESWLAATSAAQVPRTHATRGMSIQVGAAVLTVLNPSDGRGQLEDSNNGSLVLRLGYGSSSALLTGDAEEDAERELLASASPVQADVLKIGHHGSNASTTAPFLASVQPRLAVISVGAENRFGHPAAELLRRLEGIEVLRTDKQGRIELISDGKQWSIRTER